MQHDAAHVFHVGFGGSAHEAAVLVEEVVNFKLELALLVGERLPGQGQVPEGEALVVAGGAAGIVGGPHIGGDDEVGGQVVENVAGEGLGEVMGVLGGEPGVGGGLVSGVESEVEFELFGEAGMEARALAEAPGAGGVGLAVYKAGTADEAAAGRQVQVELVGGEALALTTACFWLMLSTILRQKKLSEVKNDFINNMTHELKMPLATVSAAVEALQNFGALHDAAKTQTYLAISRTELQRLSDLVEKVLHTAVDERQPLKLVPEAVQPAALVAEIVARHQLQAAKPVQFDVQVDAAPVQLDRLHLGNVLNNLIDNAIKYSREAVTITIRGRQEATGCHLSVADNGPGIDPGYQDAIFDQFSRVPTGNLHNVKGFGLGLYYVRQVVERHGGRIAVRSGPGRGSEFALWIPQ